MKINKIFLTLLSLLLFSSLISAASYTEDSDKIYYKEKISKNYYNSRYDYVLSHELEAHYNNDNRFSTYDYRHGYSYRTSREYWVDKHDFEVEDFKIVREDSNCLNCRRDRDSKYQKGYMIYLDHDRRDYSRGRHHYDRYDYDYDYYDDFGWRDYEESPRVQKMYVPYLDSYDYRECYDYVPRGKLFYISCDDWLY